MGDVRGRSGRRGKGQGARLTPYLVSAVLFGSVFWVGSRVGWLWREASLVDELRRVQVVGSAVGEHVVFGAEADSAACAQALREHLVAQWPRLWEALRHD